MSEYRRRGRRGEAEPLPLTLADHVLLGITTAILIGERLTANALWASQSLERFGAVLREMGVADE